MQLPLTKSEKKAERKKQWGHVKRYKGLLFMMMLPVIYYGIFCYWPMYGALIGFFDFNARLGLYGSKWLGLKWFANYLGDTYFWKLVRNTIVLNLWGLVIGFPAPIIFALLLNELRNETFKRVAQTICYLPHFISTVVVCGLVINFLAVSGPINNIIERLGGNKEALMMRPDLFRMIYTLSGVWQGLGWGSIIYMAALTNVDVQLYEAAVLDGANRWQQIIHITIPSIMNTIVIMLILNLGNMMSIGYEKVMLLYNGSTYETADVISTYVFRRGIQGGDLSYSTAVGLFQSVINLAFLCGSNALSRHYTETSLW